LIVAGLLIDRLVYHRSIFERVLFYFTQYWHLQLIFKLSLLLELLVFFFCNFERRKEGLHAQEYQSQRHHDLNKQLREQDQNESSELRANKYEWHHDSHQVVVNHDHVWLFWVHFLEVEEETGQSRNEDGKAADGNCTLGLEAEHANQDRNRNSSASNARYIA